GCGDSVRPSLPASVSATNVLSPAAPSGWPVLVFSWKEWCCHGEAQNRCVPDRSVQRGPRGSCGLGGRPRTRGRGEGGAGGGGGPAARLEAEQRARQAAQAEEARRKALQGVGQKANRQISENNMKEILLAMHNYEAANGRLPAAAVYDKNGKPLLSW